MNVKNQGSRPENRPRARVASSIDGRLRLKIEPHASRRHIIENLKERLGKTSGVHDVVVNHTTGSMTVRYDSRQHSRDGMLGLMRDLDVLVESVAHPSEVSAAGGPGGPTDFRAAVDDLNRRLSSATGLQIDLKVLLPLSFAAAGLWSVSRQGLMISQIPGWLFLWMAVDLFVKLHPADAQGSRV